MKAEQEFNNRRYPSLYNWFTNWRYLSEYKDVKKRMIEELDNVKINIQTKNRFQTFYKFLQDLEEYYVKEAKFPTEGSKLGNKLKCCKKNYKNKSGSIWNNIEIRELWESFS